MTKPQIKQISNYLNNLENSLNSQDYSPTTLQTELSKIYETIKLLMDETFKAKDRELKIQLAYMELRLRKCRDKIEMGLGIRN